MHFVYKLDHLFQSTRVSDENSCFKGISFFLTYFNSRHFLYPTCNIQSHIPKFHPFWLHLLFFMHLMIYFELNDPIIGKHYNLNLEKFKLGMASSFDPHKMCAKVERITTKIGCTSCTNCTISFKEQGFQTKTHLLQRHFIFLNLFLLKTFFASNMKIQSNILKFQPFLTSFAIFHAFNDLFWAKCPYN